MKNLSFFVVAVFVFSVWSCQTDEQTVTNDATNNFTKTSPISNLISRVSQFETTTDNVLDGTSNCSIKLPVHVTVDGQYVYVASEAGYQQVQNIKNQSNTDDDIVHFAFPLTMIYPSYYEHSVSTQTEFDSIMAGYGDDSSSREISCLNFNYPISINIYNTDNQVASTATIATDSQFYNFIRDLNDSQIVGLVFPITVINASSQQVTISNNAQLENAINDAVNNCSTNPTPDTLSSVLTSGSWHISYCFHDGSQTNQYYGYNFTFNSNGTSIAVKASTTIHGDWDIDNGPRLDLHFDGSDLHELETNWDVQEYTSTYIRLRGSSGGPGPGEQSYVNFTKN